MILDRQAIDTLRTLGRRRLEEALAAYLSGLKLKPDLSEAFADLGGLPMDRSSSEIPPAQSPR